VCGGALRGAGNSRVPMFIMVGSFVVFRQCYLYVMANFICNEFLPVAMGYPAGWLVCSSLMYLYYRKANLGKNRLVDT
jgi:Na+-driven multidrug efflux pump